MSNNEPNPPTFIMPQTYWGAKASPKPYVYNIAKEAISVPPPMPDAKDGNSLRKLGFKENKLTIMKNKSFGDLDIPTVTPIGRKAISLIEHTKSHNATRPPSTQCSLRAAFVHSRNSLKYCMPKRQKLLNKPDLKKTSS